MNLNRWPGYLEDTPRARTLALLDDRRIITQDGDVYAVHSWADIKSIGLALDLELYTSEIVDSWWFAGALADTSVKVMIPASIMLHAATPITSLYAQERRKRVWIICGRAWGHSSVGRDFLRCLSALFALCGVGVRPTPGSLGQALMRSHWKQEKRAFVSHPPNAARKVLLNECLGGRVDYFVTSDETFDTVFETDLTSAYCSVVDLLPGGYTVALGQEPDLTCVTYYMRCHIRIPADGVVAFGIFGIKGALSNEYPTQPGEYDAWLWKEEVDQCRRAGWVVMPQYGWGWTKWNTGLTSWSQHMFMLRQMATSLDSVLAAWIKQTIVSALGRFGMPLFQWALVPETSAFVQPGDIGLSLHGRQSGFVLHRTQEWNATHLSHWYSYILMRCRLVLRMRMMYEAERGNTVYMSNYDALYCRLPADPVSAGYHLGNWKQAQLTSVRFPFPRGVIAAEKRTLPGVKR